MIEIDGAAGEGGGQILRSSLTLSMLTGVPFRIRQIRAGRPKSGLLRQHLTAVRAAAALSEAEMEGEEMRSTDLTFRPGRVKPGSYRFEVGSAGSANLVLQTVLPVLLLADAPSEIIVTGGTHNLASPPTTFLQRTLLPVLIRMGAQVQLDLDRWGFFPAGGGQVRATVLPADRLSPLRMDERGAVGRVQVEAVLAHLRRAIVHRELGVIKEAMDLRRRDLEWSEVDSDGPGNVVMATCHAEHVTAVFTAFGRRGVRAERVATEVVEAVQRWRSLDVPVGPHLADQLMIPMAMAGEGHFVTGPLTPHATTNAAVIEQFTGRAFRMDSLGNRRIRVSLGGEPSGA